VDALDTKTERVLAKTGQAITWFPLCAGEVGWSSPMQAAVYRTGNVTPGKINASVLFHIAYP